MTDRIVEKSEASPRFKARPAGVFELLEAVTAAFAQVIVLNRFIVFGNAAATAANILRFRSAFLPRTIGVLTAIAGLGWLSFLSPTLGYRQFLYVAAFGLLAAAG